MTIAVAGPVLTEGLRTEFDSVYLDIRNRQSSSMLAEVMDLNVKSDNAYGIFGYWNAAPHLKRWDRGMPVPTSTMDSVQWTVPVYTMAMRIPWHKDDRKDDRTQSLYDMARRTGDSAGLTPERIFFEILENAPDLLPGIPTAADGAALFSQTDGKGFSRFGVTGGNLLTGTGVGSIAAVENDFYAALEQAMQFQDGQGQPLWAPERLTQDAIVIHGAANTKVMEQTFMQQRQGFDLGSGAGATPSNLIKDAARRVRLWGTPRITTDDFYVFFPQAPQKPTFFQEREALKTSEATEDGDNSDHVRNTGEEYIQFEERSGGGIVLPYACVKINN